MDKLRWVFTHSVVCLDTGFDRVATKQAKIKIGKRAERMIFMKQKIKKVVIAAAAVMMLVSGATIVESAELSQADAQGYVEIMPFVSGCFFVVTRAGGVDVFAGEHSPHVIDRLPLGHVTWGTPVGGNNGRIRIGVGRYILHTGVTVSSCG